MSYIKEIKEKNISNLTHRRFIRFSIGDFEKTPTSISVKKSSVKVSSDAFDRIELFEIARSIAGSEILVNGLFQGILDVSVLPDGMLQSERKRGAIKRYVLNGEIGSDFIDLLFENYGYFLGTIKGDGFVLSTKKKLPKSNELMKNFITLTVQNKDISSILRDVFQIPYSVTSLSGKIYYRILVNEISVPPNATGDEVRTLSKRKGKIVRTLEFGSSRIEEEIPFEI